MMWEHPPKFIVNWFGQVDAGNTWDGFGGVLTSLDDDPPGLFLSLPVHCIEYCAQLPPWSPSGEISPPSKKKKRKQDSRKRSDGGSKTSLAVGCVCGFRACVLEVLHSDPVWACIFLRFGKDQKVVMAVNEQPTLASAGN